MAMYVRDCWKWLDLKWMCIEWAFHFILCMLALLNVWSWKGWWNGKDSWLGELWDEIWYVFWSRFHVRVWNWFGQLPIEGVCLLWIQHMSWMCTCLDVDFHLNWVWFVNSSKFFFMLTWYWLLHIFSWMCSWPDSSLYSFCNWSAAFIIIGHALNNLSMLCKWD